MIANTCATCARFRAVYCSQRNTETAPETAACCWYEENAMVKNVFTEGGAPVPSEFQALIDATDSAWDEYQKHPTEELHALYVAAMLAERAARERLTNDH